MSKIKDFHAVLIVALHVILTSYADALFLIWQGNLQRVELCRKDRTPVLTNPCFHAFAVFCIISAEELYSIKWFKCLRFLS